MDAINKLLSHVEESVELNGEDRRLIRSYFKTRQLEKKESLLFKGDVSREMRFIADGCLRCYNIDPKGEEHILHFGIEGWWINDLYSYLTQTPAKFFIQALEDSTLLQVDRSDLELLLDKSPALERFFRIKIQNAYVVLQERTIHAMSKTAKERYEDFRTRYPSIERRVPQYMIASYLGITPEFLSTIRNELSSG
ncbi:MAG: Crp/Fnr family transcriptional regulator [Balneolaceae bacterium]|nr:Crp/Fnr family transcriptional regulator [Balneolaceae bacterium]